MSSISLLTPAHIDEDLIYEVVVKVNDFICEKNISFRKNPLKPKSKPKENADFYDEFIECLNERLNNGVKFLTEMFDIRIDRTDVSSEFSELAIDAFDNVMLNSSPSREVSVEEKAELKKSIVSLFA